MRNGGDGDGQAATWFDTSRTLHPLRMDGDGMTRVVYQGEALAAHNAAAEMRSVIRAALSERVPHIRCRVCTVGACVDVVVFDADDLVRRVRSGEPCPIRTVIEATLPELPVGTVSVSYEVTA